MKFILPGKSRLLPSQRPDRVGKGSWWRRAETQAVIPQFRLSRILVPTDFSPGSRAALRYAASLAQPFGARLSLLHVVPLDFGEGEFSLINFPFSKNRLLRQAEQQLAEWLARKPVGPVSTTKLVRLGPPVAEIARAAVELRSDLIVLVTRGHTGLSHMFLGSTAERVVRYAPCPVLTVHEAGTAPRTF